MTTRFYNHDLSETVLAPAIQFGDTREWRRVQSTRDTYSGYMTTTDRGFKQKIFSGLLVEVDHETMLDLEYFFNETIQWGLNVFHIAIRNQRVSENWNQLVYEPYADATANLVMIKSDGSIDVGDRVPLDFEFIRNLRIKQEGFRVVARFEGIYDISISGVVENYE